MRRNQAMLLGAVGVCMLGLITACGSNGPGKSGSGQAGQSSNQASGGSNQTTASSNQSSDAANSAQNATTATAAVKDGGSITIGQPQPFNDTFLPFETSSGYTNFVNQFAWDTLLTTDNKLNFQPMLADKWSWSSDHMTLTMDLRSGLKWSDGTPITSDDVLFAMNTLASPDYQKYVQGPDSYYVSSVVGYNQIQKGQATSFADTGGFKKISDTEFQIKFSTVDAAVLYSDIANIAPLPAHYLKGTPMKDWLTSGVSKQPMVVSGAYEYSKVNGRDSVVLTANPNYWNGKPHIQTVTIKTINSSVAPGLLADGTIDMYSGFQPSDVPKLKNIPNATIKTYPTLNYSFIGLKLYQPEFQDVRVRQAIEYALNRPEMIKGVTAGLGSVANSPIVPFSWAGASAQDGLNMYPYDPKKAEQLLDEAGWKMQANGWRIDPTTHKTADIHMLYSTSSPSQQTEALSIQQYLKAVGVKVTLDTPLDFNAFVSTILGKGKNVQMFIVSFGPSIDPDPREMWTSTATFNVDDWSDSQNEALIKKTYNAAAFNKQDRKQALVNWQLYVNKELPQLFLWQNSGLYVYNNRLHIPAADWEVYGPINFNNWWVS